jgi:hypothetical protein
MSAIMNSGMRSSQLVQKLIRLQNKKAEEKISELQNLFHAFLQINQNTAGDIS